jgi:hypothetical protein|tara:strand:+ start:772 stop:1215 length:444 start_codon:yes stop_codon:yes gene_type:complete
MSKSKKANTKPFNFNKEFVKVSNTYDNTNYIYDGSDDTINTEADMLKKFTAQEKYKLYKQVANNQEKKEFRDIERKHKKKSSIEARREPFKRDSNTGLPLDVHEFPNFLKPKKTVKEDDTLKKILEDRNKTDPDLFKGLGTFLTKKI